MHSREPQGGNRGHRVAPGERQQGRAQLGERRGRDLLQQREHGAPLGGVAPVPGVRSRRLEQLLRLLHATAVQGDPASLRQRVDAGIAREGLGGAVEVAAPDPCLREPEAERGAALRGEPAFGVQPPSRFVELPPVDQSFDHRALRERLRVGRRRRVPRDALEHVTRRGAVAGLEERPGRVGSGAHGEGFRDHLREPGERERPHPARGRRVRRRSEIGEAPQRVRRVG